MPDADQDAEQELISQIRDKNPEEFGKLIEKYQQRLFVYILRYINDQDKAEDILQESFIKMYTNLKSFDISKPFAPWAYRITHNETINFIKKNRTMVSVEENDWLPELIDDNDLTEELDKKMQGQKVYAQLSNMPMKYREVLILHYFQGYDYKNIATILHIPTSTVGTRIKRAQTRLKQMLAQEEFSHV